MTTTETANAAATAAEKEAANKAAAAKEAASKAAEAKQKEAPSKAAEAKAKKEIASKVEHDVKVMSLGSKHPDHNPAKGLIVQTPSKAVIEDAREQAQRKHETQPSSPADWRDLPNSEGKTHWQVVEEKEQKK